MKRRVLCLIISLALCLNLCPVTASAGWDDTGSGINENHTALETFVFEDVRSFDTREYTLSGSCSPLIQVTGTGALSLKGTVSATGNVGVEVLSGGALYIEDEGTSVTGAAYALDIASGATVRLSGGKYSGPHRAILTADGDFAALLGEDCAFYDLNGSLLTPVDAASAKVLSVGKCTGHSEHSWTHKTGTTEHSWTCPYCGAEETETCSFTFGEDGNGTCDYCENAIAVAVDETDLTGLVYDGTVKPEDVSITVSLADGTGRELVKDTDYTVDYKPQKDAGEVRVTVTGITFGGTFVKTFYVEPDKPGISWNAAACTVDYDGSPVDSEDLPGITITIKASEDLHPYLQYAYRTAETEDEFTGGLPTNAGKYEVKAYLEKSNNFEAAETELLTLTVNKIPAVTTAPLGRTAEYNREAQELVTAGALKPGAAAEGAEIVFARAKDGPYSTDIPTETNVSTYYVWYRVADTENFTGQSGQLTARINHREIEPAVELDYYKTMFTGEYKEPGVTVKDGEYVIPKSEYTFSYSDNRNVGTATVTVNNADNGNYKLKPATATFQITSKEQEALSITKQPDTITYGDKFTLGTTGGSGSGDVTWEIIDVGGVKVAEVGAKSGQVTIVGDGEFTVKATKSGKDPANASIINYDDATASWTVTAEKKKVTATVTAEDKFYGETYGGDDLKAARVHAAVEQGVLPGDEITITGLTGTFSDENAGENKTVTVDISGASITGNNSGHYAVTYSSTTVTAAIHKAVVHITKEKDAAALTYSGAAQALIGDDVLKADAAGVSVEYAMSEDGSYSTNIPEGTNAGNYTVWYRVEETDNYTGLPPASVDVTISKKQVTPTVELSGNGLTAAADGTCSYIYDGNEKKPTVTVKDGVDVIPESNYTVGYSNNINVGDATVTVTSTDGGNYEFTPNNPVTEKFEIKKEPARVLTAPEAAGDPLTFNNRDQKLVTAGAAYGGTMVYSLDKDNGDSYSANIPVKTDAAKYTVYYKVQGDGNHSDSEVGEAAVTIAPKTVKDPTIELFDGENPLVSYTYDGSAKMPTVVVKDGSDVIFAGDDSKPGEYNVLYSDNIDAGKGTVNITDKPGGNYTVTGSTTFVIQKADIEFNPASSAAVITYDGKPHELLVPGTTSGGEVLYALNSPTSTYTAAIPTATEAGTYRVWYKVNGDKNHNSLAATEVEGVKINRKPLTEVTIELSPESFEYDGTAKMPEIKVWDGKTLLPEGEYEWVCTDAENNRVESPTNVGTYTIKITDKADGNYDLAGVTENTKDFTIGQIPQEELVIGGKPAATNYGDSFQLTVSGGSGDGEVTWERTGPVSVDVDADGKASFTITGVGDVTVTVKKAADNNYLAAETQWSFTAAPRPVEAAVRVDNKPYDGNTSATVSSAGIAAINGDTVIIDTNSISAAFDTPSVGEGKTVTLDASKVEVTGDDAGKYAISYPETVTANITQAAAEITTAPGKIDPLTYSGQAQALVTAGKTNVGFIVYSLNENGPYSEEIPTGTNAGTYNVYYKVDGTDDYTGVTVNGAPVEVTIAPKPITTPVIEVTENSYPYDGARKNPTITVMDGETVVDKKQYTVVWTDENGQTVTELKAAGTYTAAIKNVDGGNYTFSATATAEIVAATQNSLEITGKPEHVYYGDTVKPGATGGPGNGKVTWSITAGESSADIDPDTGELTVTGTGSITVTAERTLPNYAPVTDTWTFTVEPKPVIADVTVKPKAYDGTNSIDENDITAEVKSSDLVDSADTISIVGLKGTFADVNAGTGKTVNLARDGFTVTCDTGKYAVSIPDTAHADITPREVNVSVTLSDHDLQTDDSGKYYYAFDGAEKRPNVTVTCSDEGGYSAALAASDYTVDYAKNKNVGTADVTVTASEGGNYTFVTAKVQFEIQRRAAVLTETPKAKDLTYDGSAQDLVNVGTATGGTVMYSPTGASGSYSEAIPHETNAGTYTVYYMVKGDANHDDTAPGQVSVTIKPKTITPKITLNPASYVYDGNECRPTVTVSGGVNTGADLDPIAETEYSVDYLNNTGAGTATVTVSDNNGGNYIVNGTATFKIEKAPPVFDAPEMKTGLQYSGAVQELVKAGVSGDGTVAYSVNGGNYSSAIPSASAVGDYEISYKVLGDANHSDTAPTELGTVTIARNTVNTPGITLSSYQFQYNGSEQKPTVTVRDDNGLVIPEHEYTVKIEGKNDSSAMVDVDTYTVTVTTPENSNYIITTGNTRTFEIVPANQETVSITGIKAQVRYGDTIQLGITGGTGSGTVTWEVKGADGNAVNSEISSTGLLTVKDQGKTLTVTVKRSAGGNYNEVSAAWEFSAAKKQVTAVVTADDRDFIDGNKTATVHVSVPASALVEGDSITINGVTGEFDDPNVGTDKKVTVDSDGASVTGTNADNYEITYPAATAASIKAIAATVDAGPGTVTPALTYDASQAQELVTAGTVTGGIMVYSLDGSNFTSSIPKAKDADTYTVYFKAQGDGNHTDSEVDSVQATVGKQNVNPTVGLSPSGAKYDGGEHKPTVTLWDGDNNVIPASEYKVTYVSDNNENWTDKGDYTVKIEDIDRGNYVIADGVTAQFTISTTAQDPLEITNKPGFVYYGDTFTLSAVGGSGNAAVTWSAEPAAGVVEIDQNGFVKIVGTGSATITATRPGGANYDDATATYPLNALRKPVTAIVSADDRVFAENDTSVTINVSWKAGDLVGNDSINTTPITGSFADANVGQDKAVTVNGDPVNDATSQKYAITIPRTTTASILKADTDAPAVTANTLEYNRSAQALVIGGDTDTRYSNSRDGVYSTNVPTGTNAGTYTVWYKELGDANHNDSAPQDVTVTISPRKPETLDITLSGNDLKKDEDGNCSYVFDGSDKEPNVTIKDGDAVVPAGEYAVSYSNNKNVSTDDAKGTVTITCNEGGNYTFAEQTVNFTITGAAAQLTKSPEARSLTYTGQEQELVTVGTASGGHIEYLQDNDTYSEAIPKGTNAGTYTVTYKVVGDGNYTSSGETWTVSVTIKPKEVVSPEVTVEVTGGCTYDGSPKEPGKTDDDEVKVKDGETTIPTDEYTVSYRDNINAGTATVVITNANGGNYIVNGTGSFIIGKADVSDVKPPVGKTGLPYNGAAQELITAGSASSGTMVYALSEDGDYSPAIPTQTAVGNYDIYYKVQGDSNHNDTVPEPDPVAASIIVNTVDNPTVQVTPGSVTFNGKKQEPTVTVKDGSGMLIDGSEYTVTYKDAEGNADLTKAGTYTVTVKNTESSNYRINDSSKTFEILAADQTPLTITGTRERVCYGDKFQLGTSGGSDGGTIEWKVEGKDAGGSDIASISSGLLTIAGVGSVTVTATSSAAGYTDQTATWTFFAEKKQVNAVVTAEAKTYDGETDATVTATLQDSDLVSGDTVKITLPGSSFEDASAGTDKKVNVDRTNPDFSECKGNYENYIINYPATATASIFKADVDETKVTAPTAETGLEYTGLAQYLVKAGSSPEGTLEYSTDNSTYSTSLPTGTDADSYDVWYRVKGDGNHKDTAGTKLTETTRITIARQKVENPVIELTPTGALYDGGVHKPTVTIKDNNGRIIPDLEYDVEYGDTDWRSAKDHTVTVKNKAGKVGGNYDITDTPKTFTISATGQSPLSIVNQPGKVQYGDSFTLSTNGGSGTGTVTWSSDKQDIATIDQNGLVTIWKAGGPITITATREADGYGTTTASWTFSAEKRPVTAIVTAKDKEYDSKLDAELVISWKPGDLLNGDTVTLNLTGTFSNANVGDNKTVNIAGTPPDNDKYKISWNDTTTASITAGAATVIAPTPKELTYNGQRQELVIGGSATNGDILYSLDDVIYSRDIPKETNAGTYTVWYKVEGSANYADVAPKALPVTISPKTLNVTGENVTLSPDSFDYDGSPKRPDVTVKDSSKVIPAGEYLVGYSNNVQAGNDTAKVIISDAEGGNYTVSGEVTFTIKAGTATLTLAPQEKDLTYTGKAQALVTAGSAVNGHLEYSTDGTSYNMAIPKETDADDYDVYYKVVGNPGYGDTSPQTLTVTISPKQVTPTVLVEGKTKYSTPYTDGDLEPGVTVVVEGEPLTPVKDYYIVGYADNRNPGTASVTVQSRSNGNYKFYTTATFEITKAKAEFDLVPAPVENLVYTGEEQELVYSGEGKNDCTVVYSLSGGEFSPFIPTATEVGSYAVRAKVEGNDFYADSDVKSYRVSIGKNTIAENKLNVDLSDNSLKYTGSELKPTVTVQDVENNVIIPASEYSVSYKNNINVGQADVTVTSTTRNYSFSKTVHFTITEGDAPELTITGLPETVYYGDTFRLGTTGGSGTVTWKVESGEAASQGGGQFRITGPGPITISATAGGVTKTKDLYAYPKPVKAIVTAEDKTYDGNTSVTSWSVIVTGLVSGDSIGSDSFTVTGYFRNASAGADKTVYITGLTVPDEISRKYDISRDDTTTATIIPAEAKVNEEKAPTAKTGLQYTGEPLELVNRGEASGGNIKYSLDGENYTYAVPTGKDAKSYTVWYKAVADNSNYRDSKAVEMEPVKIAPNTDTPSVLCVPDTFQFDGSAKTPAVVVRDGENRIIPESEYTVTIPTAIAAKDESYEVAVTDNPGGNYEFSSTTGGAFKIVASSQAPLSIITEKPSDVYYGDTFRLSAMGGSGSGAIQWSIKEENAPAAVDGNGVVKVTGTGGFTVQAYREASDGYGKSNTASVPFVANPKPITAVAKAASRGYDTSKNTAVTLTVPEINAEITATGTFDDENVGTNKTVKIVYSEDPKVTDPNYQITWPETTTASIYMVDVKIETENAPKPVEGLTYTVENGQPKAQELLTGGATVGGIGTIVYSTSEKGVYSENIPTGTNAGMYSVWYKVADSVNYTGIPAAEVEVEIKKADPYISSHPAASGWGETLSAIRLDGGATDIPGNFEWEDGSIKPTSGTSYNVIFRPNDEYKANYNTRTIQVQVTAPVQQTSNEPSSTPAQAQTQTTVRGGTASTVLSASDGSRLVQQAVASKSRNVVIKPEITGDVTKSEVSIPSSTVSKLSSDTDAALTVSSPVADVTIPNKALDTLGQSGGSVSVAVGNAEQSVALTVTSGGETVKQVPGGVTLSVPVEDAAPGTVAVLVNEDGTRETVRNSVVTDGVMSIPLSGSATVEIVDNSKDFDDVPPESWEAGAVDFASSHELFGGTSETTFSPDLAMSRGMLATVLYRLEGNPEMDLTDAFSDVSDGAWYADGVAWATENGIAGGYGDGQFGPNDDVTREQFVVMLWRYAGSPEAGSQALDFVDADRASGYALEALCWAVENGILNGVGGGMLDPGGTATRAQAAQLLKNFMEKT
ncbi:MAG: YDG domain-containing protein [Butyricicoccus sp.]|nr:YDG domain-containing protein [Butyricicoccus sp.]